MFRRVMLIALTSGCLTQTAAGAPRLYVVQAVVESTDVAVSVRLDTDGLNVVAFTLQLDNLSTCMESMGAGLGADAIAAGLNPDEIHWSSGSAGTGQPVPPPYDGFVECDIDPPQQPISGLAGSGLEIAQLYFFCSARPSECPLGWDPVFSGSVGPMRLLLADGTVVSAGQIDLVAPQPVNCEAPISVEQPDWGRVKSLYRDPRP